MVRDYGPTMNEGFHLPLNRARRGVGQYCQARYGGSCFEEMVQMLRGSITALITPFANGAVDEKAFSACRSDTCDGHHPMVPVR